MSKSCLYKGVHPGTNITSPRSIYSEPMKYHSPYFRKTCYKKSRKNLSSSSANISDVSFLFLVIDRFPDAHFLLDPPISPVPVKFSPILQVLPHLKLFFRCSHVLTLNFLPLLPKCYISFPPK